MEAERVKRFNDLGLELQRAESHRDWREAERLELERMQFDFLGKNPMEYLTLSGIYEAEHRKRDAFDAMHEALESPTKSYSNERSDPIQLVHYAELALSLHESSTAVKAFRGASTGSAVSDIHTESLLPGETLDRLRASAHFAAAEERIPHGLIFEAMDDLRLSIKLEPKVFATRLAYARLLHMRERYQESLAEYRTAYFLAPADQRKTIHDEVVNEKHLVQEDMDESITTNGKITHVNHHLRDWPGKQ